MLRRQFDPKKSYTYVEYGRMSDDSQNPRSPDQQFDTIRSELARQQLPWTALSEPFRDDGVRGRYIRRRPGYQKLMTKIRAGMLKPDLILVDTWERFGRAEEFQSIRRELETKFGILVLTADTHFADPTSPQGRVMAAVENIRATEDGRIKAHNVLRGKRDAVGLKHWPGGPPPLGWKLRSVMTTSKGHEEIDHRVIEHDVASAWIAKKLFKCAKETGYGTTRLAKSFNADPDIPDKYKPFYPDSIGYILDNELYIGNMVWAQHCTGIVNDQRVIQRNPEDEVTRVDGFCEPMIDMETWNAVQALRRKRSEQILRQRRSSGEDTKLIAPLTPGMTLKYLLTGLVRCGHCGRAMQPSSSRNVGRQHKDYIYYRCPSNTAGACSNKRYVPEPWLRRMVIGKLRERLLPPPSSDQDVPTWFPDFIQEVEEELARLSKDAEDRRPALRKEIEEHRKRMMGWSMSLGDPGLDSMVRQDIEKQYGETKRQILDTERTLQELDARAGAVKSILDPTMVIDRLHHLDEVLAGGNPTAGNLELSLHIDRIEAYDDGRVVMVTSKLGLFEGLSRILAPSVAPASDSPAPTSGNRITPRQRSPLAIHEADTEERGSSTVHEARSPRRFAGLREEFFWKDDFEMPQASSWAAQHAAEVTALRNAKWTMAKLAEHFGKSIPTIRHALRIAGSGGSATPASQAGKESA